MDSSLDETILSSIQKDFEPDQAKNIHGSTQLENKFLQVTMELLAKNLVRQ